MNIKYLTKMLLKKKLNKKHYVCFFHMTWNKHLELTWELKNGRVIKSKSYFGAGRHRKNHPVHFIYFFLKFIYLFMAVLGFRFWARAFSSCGKWGPLFIVVRRPLTTVASLVEEHSLQTRRLSNCGHGPSCSAACGIFPDQGSNPWPQHWQADSQPLCHQGSPSSLYFNLVYTT